MDIRKVKGCFDFLDEKNTQQILRLCSGCKDCIKNIAFYDEDDKMKVTNLPEPIKKEVCHALRGITLYSINIGD